MRRIPSIWDRNSRPWLASYQRCKPPMRELQRARMLIITRHSNWIKVVANSIWVNESPLLQSPMEVRTSWSFTMALSRIIISKMAERTLPTRKPVVILLLFVNLVISCTRFEPSALSETSIYQFKQNPLTCLYFFNFLPNFVKIVCVVLIIVFRPCPRVGS